MLVANLRIRQIGLCRVRLALDRYLLIVVVEDAREERERARKIDANVQQRTDRPVQPVHKRNHRRNGTNRQYGVFLRNDQPAARKIDQQRPNLRKGANQHDKPFSAAQFLERQFRHAFIYTYETIVLGLLARK
ncbi:hypothetical protein SDC9_136740 [bioreactor metagenome]|uniref:Uncharacterized protein n=1 Tax=bioreactor metagenome TaxID=1076179 RepID=A0A645DKN9_9ZZZZ